MWRRALAWRPTAHWEASPTREIRCLSLGAHMAFGSTILSWNDAWQALMTSWQRTTSRTSPIRFGMSGAIFSTKCASQHPTKATKSWARSSIWPRKGTSTSSITQVSTRCTFEVIKMVKIGQSLTLNATCRSKVRLLISSAKAATKFRGTATPRSTWCFEKLTTSMVWRHRCPSARIVAKTCGQTLTCEQTLAGWSKTQGSRCRASRNTCKAQLFTNGVSRF